MTATIATFERITATEAKAKLDAGAAIIDVRTPVEFRTEHAPGSLHVELSEIEKQPRLLNELVPGEAPLLFMCKAGVRAAKAAGLAELEGDRSRFVIEGGIDAWTQAKLPIEGERKVISLERQVRICAGGIAALGALGALLLNPWYALIPLFIGSGLTFAGITNTCGMAMVLAKAPWNR